MHSVIVIFLCQELNLQVSIEPQLQNCECSSIACNTVRVVYFVTISTDSAMYIFSLFRVENQAIISSSKVLDKCVYINLANRCQQGCCTRLLQAGGRGYQFWVILGCDLVVRTW